MKKRHRVQRAVFAAVVGAVVGGACSFFAASALAGEVKVIEAPALVGQASVKAQEDVVYRSAARAVSVAKFDAPRHTLNTGGAAAPAPRPTQVWRATPSGEQARIVSRATPQPAAPQAGQPVRTADYTVARFTAPSQEQVQPVVNANLAEQPARVVSAQASQSQTVSQVYVTGLETGNPTPVQYSETTPPQQYANTAQTQPQTQPYISGPVSVPQPQPAPAPQQQLYYPTGVYNHPTVVRQEVHYYPVYTPVVYHRPVYYPRPVVYCPPTSYYRTSFYYGYGHGYRGHYGHHRGHYGHHRGHYGHHRGGYGRGHGGSSSHVGVSVSFGKRW